MTTMYLGYAPEHIVRWVNKYDVRVNAMSARTTYNEDNKVIMSGFARYTEVEKIFGTWTYFDGAVLVELHEMNLTKLYTTYSYKYVGMTYETAVQCRDTLIELLTRDKKYSKWSQEAAEFVDLDAGKCLMSDVYMTDERGLWSVVVNVQEEDECQRRMTPVNFRHVYERVYDL